MRTVDRTLVHHLPLILTAEGARRMTSEKLHELQRMSLQDIHFIADSRFIDDGLSGCILTGYYCDGREFELGCWEWADLTHQVLDIEVDIERRDCLYSLLHHLGQSATTVHH